VNRRERKRTTARKARQRYRKFGPRSLVPRRVMLGIPPSPRAPPKKGTYRKTDSTMKLMPMVVTARKSSRSRRLGMPSTSPMAPVRRITSGRAVQNVRPAFVVRRAEA